jgi:flagellin
MRINHNIAALNTYRQLTAGSTAASKNMEKLSSGLRINRAGDDAAGLAISEKMRGQIRGLEQAARNSQDAISLIQTAEGALNETHAILQRMRELAVQAANDTNTADDRAELQKEMNQLTEEINRIGNNTEFNTKKLINGDLTGAGSGAIQEDVSFDFSGIVAGATGNTVLTIGGTDYTIVWDNAKNADGSQDTFSGTTIYIGTNGADPNNIGDRIEAQFLAMRGANPSLSISEFDFSQSAAETLRIEATAGGAYDGAAGQGMITFKSGVNPVTTVNAQGSNGTNGTATFQVGANADQQFSVSISDMRAVALGIASTNAGGDADGGAGQAVFASGVANEITKDVTSGTEYALDISDATKATDAIKVIDEAIKKVSTERSKLGAYQNRLEHTINNLGTSAENLTAAESRIRDVDMAKEMMEFTKNNILSQAAQAMLAQSNQIPQGVLQLLR